MPEVYDDLQWLVDAFCSITSSRQVGFGLGPIPLSEIKTYVELFPIPEDLETFVRLLRTMDNEYLAAMAEKQKRDGNSTQTRN